MKNRLILVTLIIAATATTVLAQDSVMRTQSTAVSMHPADCQSRSQSQTTDESAVEEAQHERVDWPHIGMEFTVAVGNLFYIPAKIAYGTLGGVAGGAAYVFSRDDRHTARRIWNNSLGGDYVLTPAMISGQEPIHFMGFASRSSSGANAASPINKSPSSSRVSLPQSVAAVNTKKPGNWAVPFSNEINVHHSNPATLEIPPLVERQSGLSEANKRTASGVARTPDFEGIPPMSIEPQ
jgi:hypothetical protein